MYMYNPNVSLIIALKIFQQVCYCLQWSFNFLSIITHCNGIVQHKFQLMLDPFHQIAPANLIDVQWSIIHFDITTEGDP
jgi:hypothetical protein